MSVAERRSSDDRRLRGEGMQEKIAERAGYSVRSLFEPELSMVEPPERREILIASEALGEFESGAPMRAMSGISTEEGCAAWAVALDSLMPARPAVS